MAENQGSDAVVLEAVVFCSK